MKSKKPEIRFKGFSEEWEEKVLHNIADVRDGTHDSPQYFPRGRPFVTSKNVKDGYINFDDVQYISEVDFVEINKRSKVDINDILMGMIGTIGNIALVREEPDFAIKNVALIKDTTNVYYLYLYYYLQSPIVLRQLVEGMDGGTQKFIALNKVRNLTVSTPKPDEQTQIGHFFKNLDSLITLHQRKVEKLGILKKAMFEKMFPKNGANVPEIRFKGFEGAWEERKLLDNIDKVIDFRGRTPKKLGLDWSETGYLALSALNVKSGYIDPLIEAHYGNQELYEKWMIGNELHKNQVLFTTEAPMGNVAQIPDDKRYILSQRTIAFNVNHSLITEDFLAVVLGSPQMFIKLSSLSSGGTAKGISQKSLATVDLLLPKDIYEQEKIGTYFKNLDKLLTLHQGELGKLKNLKKALLEKMFV